jgi:hypothetical protein
VVVSGILTAFDGAGDIDIICGISLGAVSFEGEVIAGAFEIGAVFTGVISEVSIASISLRIDSAGSLLPRQPERGIIRIRRRKTYKYIFLLSKVKERSGFVIVAP